MESSAYPEQPALDGIKSWVSEFLRVFYHRQTVACSPDLKAEGCVNKKVVVPLMKTILQTPLIDPVAGLMARGLASQRL